MLRYRLLLWVLLGAVGTAQAQTIDPLTPTWAPPEEPMLVIEAGMHTSSIKSITADAQGRFIMTAAQDKTLRLWDAATGQLQRIIRLPIDQGDIGKIYSADLSPDGRYIAVGGWMMPSDQYEVIYVFDRATGKLVHRITGLGNVSQVIRFSRDSQRMAVVLGGTSGLQVYQVGTWQLLWKDENYRNTIYGLDFSPDGRVVTCSYDNYMRLYTPTGELELEKELIGGRQPLRVRFNNDGSLIALSYEDNPKLEVFATKKLKLVAEPSVAGILSDDNVADMAFSPLTGSFWAAGNHAYQNELGWQKQLLYYAPGKFDGFKEIPLPVYNTVMHLMPNPAGGVLYAASDPAWGWVDEVGTQRLQQDPPIADYRNLWDDLKLSSDGSVVQFAYLFGSKDKAVFDLNTQAIEQNPENFPTTLQWNSPQPLGLSNYQNSYKPLFNGATLGGLKDYELVRAAAGDENTGRFIIGSGWYLRAYNYRGEVLWSVPSAGTTWAVNITADGTKAVAAYGDGTIRWYRMKDGKELLAFFPHQDRQRWVAWTPKGYYMASTGGEALIGWHINNGATQEADFFPASKFRDTYYRPDVVLRVLKSLDEDLAVNEANASRGVAATAPTRSVANALPPVVAITSPEAGTKVNQTTLTLTYTVRTPSDAPITGVRALIDGRPYAPARDAGGELVFRDVQLKGDEATLEIEIPKKDCVVSILAENKHGTSEAASVSLTWAGQDNNYLKPKLYMLAIGVSDYQNDEYDLRYAATDARDLSAAFKKQNGHLYGEVITKVLTDKDATRDNILDAMVWLEQNTTQFDVAVIFMSGHGINDSENDFYFLPYDADVSNPRRSCVPDREVQRTIQRITGKVIVFFDACHSGNILASGRTKGVADINSVVNELASAENGAVVFTSSTGKQVSVESEQWGNGVFTEVLIEGLSGKADPTGNGKITILGLARYLAEGVKKYTDGKQHPTLALPPNVTDYPIAVVVD